VFRADASLKIGTGHVMRCITLAAALRARGADCTFITREHIGNLISLIRSHGFHADVLPSPGSFNAAMGSDSYRQHDLAHSEWLGLPQETDAQECLRMLLGVEVDWLVVDHYALDARWERQVRGRARRLMVIDDLADRPHCCDLLLDQNFGRDAASYARLLPPECVSLCGASYALLRPEFAALREYSLQRRAGLGVRHILIAMGGVDKDNATGGVLEELARITLPHDCRITVVMGLTAPWLASVRRIASQLSWPTTVRVGISDMAQLMADADLAVGAAGATSWERCCLGLPSVILPLADNQRLACQALHESGAAIASDLDHVKDTIARLVRDQTCLALMSAAAARVTNGGGTARVADHLADASIR
jgi:UDP-2,4-diacetamido-2,4,6-trideoxy-beta-L-altropyranose hydrolase